MSVELNKSDGLNEDGTLNIRNILMLVVNDKYKDVMDLCNEFIDKNNHKKEKDRETFLFPIYHCLAFALYKFSYYNSAIDNYSKCLQILIDSNELDKQNIIGYFKNHFHMSVNEFYHRTFIKIAACYIGDHMWPNALAYINAALGSIMYDLSELERTKLSRDDYIYLIKNKAFLHTKIDMFDEAMKWYNIEAHINFLQLDELHNFLTILFTKKNINIGRS